jgi:ABC-type Zn uptake system ZnuABC Zn-binding protein ZnuA
MNSMRKICISLWLLLVLMGACTAPQSVETNADQTGQTVTQSSESIGAETVPPLASLDLPIGTKLQVVASTSLVQDVVAQIGGDALDLYGLLPLGADPHGYQPTPDDLRAISDAHLVFVNGLGLEEGLASILEEAHPKTVPVNVGIEVITTAEEEEHAEGEEEEEHHHEGGNPHTWWSIAVVEQWTHNIEQSLSAVDPAHAESYAANAEAYRAELSSLKAEMETLVSQIPVSERKLATDHDTLAYFARDFDFQIVGLIVPSFSTLAEPSAQHLAQLQDQLRAENVGAVFVGSTVNPRQAEQLAQDLGIRVVPIFTDSLSAADGPAATYVDFMRYNVKAIVAALVAAP